MNAPNTTLASNFSSRPEGRFYVAMAITAFAIAFAGFGPAAISGSGRTAPLTWAVGLHGLVFTAWLLFFLTQTLLVSKGQVTLHRRLGLAGVGLAILMVASGFPTAVTMARRGHDLSGDLIRGPADSMDQLMVFQLGDLLSFAVLVGSGIFYRNRPQVHKRLMLFATVGALMPAALAHIIGHSSTLRAIKAPIVLLPIAALLFAPAIHDRISRGRMHPASLWVAVAMLVWANVRAAVIAPSSTWHNFVSWLVR